MTECAKLRRPAGIAKFCFVFPRDVRREKGVTAVTDPLTSSHCDRAAGQVVFAAKGITDLKIEDDLPPPPNPSRRADAPVRERRTVSGAPKKADNGIEQGTRVARRLALLVSLSISAAACSASSNGDQPSSAGGSPADTGGQGAAPSGTSSGGSPANGGTTGGSMTGGTTGGATPGGEGGGGASGGDAGGGETSAMGGAAPTGGGGMAGSTPETGGSDGGTGANASGGAGAAGQAGGEGGAAAGGAGGESSGAGGQAGDAGGGAGGDAGQGGTQSTGGVGGGGSPGACVGKAWPTADPTKAGPFQVQAEKNVGPLAGVVPDPIYGNKQQRFNVYRPANLADSGYCHPILIWANGYRDNPEQNPPDCVVNAASNQWCGQYLPMLNHLASHGFVVVAPLSTATAEGDPLPTIAGLDWILEEAKDPGSIYFERLDTTSIGQLGHSYGGMSTCMSASDPRYKALATICGTRALSGVHTPMLFFCGGKDSVVSCSSVRNTFLSVTDQPAFFLNERDADHGSWVYQGPGGVSLSAAAAWFRVHLMNDTANRKYFYGANCVFCNDNRVEAEQNSLMLQ